MKQSDIKSLPNLSHYRYENFLNIYSDKDGFLFYNLLSNVNLVPSDNSNAEDSYIVKHTDTWVSISWNYYNTMDLWWLVCAYNQIQDPTKMLAPGTKIKILKASYVSVVIDSLKEQLSR